MRTYKAEGVKFLGHNGKDYFVVTEFVRKMNDKKYNTLALSVLGNDAEQYWIEGHAGSFHHRTVEGKHYFNVSQYWNGKNNNILHNAVNWEEIDWRDINDLVHDRIYRGSEFCGHYIDMVKDYVVLVKNTSNDVLCKILSIAWGSNFNNVNDMSKGDLAVLRRSDGELIMHLKNICTDPACVAIAEDCLTCAILEEDTIRVYDIS